MKPEIRTLRRPGVTLGVYNPNFGGPEVASSQHDFYKVNSVIYLTYFLYNFYEVERVLFSSLCLSTFIKSTKFCC